MDAPVASKPVRNGVLDMIENTLLSGYGKKEDLRALDKSLRDQYHGELTILRYQWEKIYLEVIEAGQSAIGLKCKAVIQTLDRVSSSINRAEYGYAPLFDRVEKIQNDSLGRVLQYDRNLASVITRLSADVNSVEASLRETSWSKVQSVVESINGDLRDLENGWGNRKNMFNDNLE